MLPLIFRPRSPASLIRVTRAHALCTNLLNPAIKPQPTKKRRGATCEIHGSRDQATQTSLRTGQTRDEVSSDLSWKDRDCTESPGKQLRRFRSLVHTGCCRPLQGYSGTP